VAQTTVERLHIVEGSVWKDAVIALLESRSPYRPWRYGFGEAREGDPVAIVLNTDPHSVLTGLGRIGVVLIPSQWTGAAAPSVGEVEAAARCLHATMIDLLVRDDPKGRWRTIGTLPANTQPPRTYAIERLGRDGAGLNRMFL
jgi:hypothetical protein